MLIELAASSTNPRLVRAAARNAATGAHVALLAANAVHDPADLVGRWPANVNITASAPRVMTAYAYHPRTTAASLRHILENCLGDTSGRLFDDYARRAPLRHLLTGERGEPAQRKHAIAAQSNEGAYMPPARRAVNIHRSRPAEFACGHHA